MAGPNTFAPLGAICKAQSAVAHCSTEAEIISLELALRTEGLLGLAAGVTKTARLERDEQQANRFPQNFRFCGFQGFAVGCCCYSL